ncbi:MAG TPA: hypothetical protein VMI11_06310, partial [Actinomycetes bacterium]|nr:hypothetical protein [Actinomycetes bacterium]
MRGLLAAAFAALLSLTTLAAGAPGPPPSGAVVSLTGRFGFAHGCAVSDRLVLTAAHVVNPFEERGDFTEWGSRFEAGGVSGYVAPALVDR